MNKIVMIVLLALLVVVVAGVVVLMNSNEGQVSSSQNQNTNPPTQNTEASEDLTEDTTGPTAQNSNTITLEMLSAHDSQEDCWIAYDGKVYDVTAWLPKHPGGAFRIAPHCGTANQFEAAFTQQHGSSQVNRLMQEGTYKGDFEL